MPFVKTATPTARFAPADDFAAQAAVSTNQAALQSTAKPKPISIFASVNGYAQAEIVVGAPRVQHPQA